MSSTTSSAVPSALLIAFLEAATKALDECQLSGREDLQDPLSLSDLRKQMLQTQMTCLHQVVSASTLDATAAATVSVEDVQHALRNLPPDVSDQAMNEAARRAFCRLVLHQECLWEERDNGRHLIRSGKIDRSALLEFMALCNTAIKLPEASSHLATGAPLFGIQGTLAAPRFASKRMERIQHMLMTAVGYDPAFGTEEIKRIFFTPKTPNEFTGDREIEEQFGQLLSSMHVAITNASLEESHLSDTDEGGVTRVVSVTYSEKVVPPDQVHEGQSIGAPRLQETAREEQNQDLRIARDAAALQQSILGQLLAMDEGDRHEALQLAKEANDAFMKRLMDLPVGPERIDFMRSMDSKTQQQLLMHKIWTGLLQAHGGKPPVMYNKT